MIYQVVIGPATVGGIQAGAFKIGDTAGTIDNIIQCKLYRPGSVGFVSKSVRNQSKLFSLFICLPTTVSFKIIHNSLANITPITGWYV